MLAIEAIIKTGIYGIKIAFGWIPKNQIKFINEKTIINDIGEAPKYEIGWPINVETTLNTFPFGVNVHAHFKAKTNVKIIIATNVGANDILTIGGTESGNFNFKFLLIKKQYNLGINKPKINAKKIPSLPI